MCLHAIHSITSFLYRFFSSMIHEHSFCWCFLVTLEFFFKSFRISKCILGVIFAGRPLPGRIASICWQLVFVDWWPARFLRSFCSLSSFICLYKDFLTPLKVVVIEECFTQSYISSEKQTLSLTRFCLPFFVERGTSATYASNLISLIVRLLFPQCVQ